MASTSRSAFPSHLHSTIDASLKSLRTVLKQLNTLEDAFAEEAQILERLYYKSKNQHRSALFWRHVGDARRIFDRMNKNKASLYVESIRGSFFEGSVAESNKAQRRQAWTRTPPPKLIISALHRFRDLSLLLAKADDVLVNAYRSFEQLLHSSTFLPLALVLIAVTSRAHALTREMHSCVEELWPTIRSIAQVLECDNKGPKSLSSRTAKVALATEPQQPMPIQPRADPPLPLLAPNSEDVGQKITRIAGVQPAPVKTLNSVSNAIASSSRVPSPLSEPQGQPPEPSTESSPLELPVDSASSRSVTASLSATSLRVEVGFQHDLTGAPSVLGSTVLPSSTVSRSGSTVVGPLAHAVDSLEPANGRQSEIGGKPRLKRPASVTLEQTSIPKKKAKTKSKRKKGDEIDDIFSGF